MGGNVGLRLVAADVIHSFFVPAFLVKRDMIPGVDNSIDIRPTEAAMVATSPPGKQAAPASRQPRKAGSRPALRECTASYRSATAAPPPPLRAYGSAYLAMLILVASPRLWWYLQYMV